MPSKESNGEASKSSSIHEKAVKGNATNGNDGPVTKVYFCLGSNIRPRENISFAIRRVEQKFSDVETSNLYLSKAVGFEGDDFLNIVLAVKTDMSLVDILGYADALEQEAGRVRVRRGRFDSRTLDVDVLMYGDLSGEYEGRIWPSEDIEQNAHVLLPMSEIAGDVKHPASGVKFEQLWQNFESGEKAEKGEKAGKAEQSLSRVDRYW